MLKMANTVPNMTPVAGCRKNAANAINQESNATTNNPCNRARRMVFERLRRRLEASTISFCV
jgi:hypothetical protein